MMQGDEYPTERERQQRLLDRETGWSPPADRGPVLLGPAPCSICGAWTEYAGGAWVALGSDELHDCTPYMGGHTPAERQPRLVVAAVARYQQAHELAEPEPEWVELVWRPIAIIAPLFVAALVVAAVARWANV